MLFKMIIGGRNIQIAIDRKPKKKVADQNLNRLYDNCNCFISFENIYKISNNLQAIISRATKDY